MRERSDAELLDIWTTNDRVTWSPEAFEAVKSLLTERGVHPMPPQNDPAPIADTHSPRRDPVTGYWLGWLRPVLWICVAVGAAGLPQALFLTGSVAVAAQQGQLPAFHRWRGPTDAMVWIDQILSNIVMPVWLLVAAVGALRLKLRARPLLLWYAAVAAVTAVVVAVLRLADPRISGLGTRWIVLVPMTIAYLPQHLVLPAVLWTLLRRPEIASLFVGSATARAFEALPATGVPAAGAPATAPAGTPPGPASPAGSSSPAAQY